MGRIDDALLFGRQIAGEARDAGPRLQPNAAVGDVNVFEDVCRGELGLYALRRFGLIRTQGRDVDEGGNAAVRAGVRDDGSAVRMAGQDDRTAKAMRGEGGPRLMVAPLLMTCPRTGSWHSRDHSGVPIRSGNASQLPLEVARCGP